MVPNCPVVLQKRDRLISEKVLAGNFGRENIWL
jgi:hypothetical protein